MQTSPPRDWRFTSQVMSKELLIKLGPSPKRWPRCPVSEPTGGILALLYHVDHVCHTSNSEIPGALVQTCLDARCVGCEVWEREIDERVAGLYGL